MSRRRRIGPSIRLRLTLTYSGLFLVAGAALLSVNYVLVKHREHKSGTAVQIVCTSGNAVSGLVQAQGSTSAPETLPPGCTSRTVKGQAPPPDVAPFGLPFAGSSLSGGVAVPAAQYPLSPSDATAARQRFADLTTIVANAQDHTLHTLEVESGLALGVMAVASLGLGWMIAGRALRPVHRITQAARQLSEETLHKRIALDGPDDELKELADTFDAMLARLDRAFASQRRFVANASHELRTPLATERVLIDEALANRQANRDELRSILEDLRTNAEQTERLIAALLLLARSQQGVENWTATDLADLARQVVDRAGAEAVTAGVEITTDLMPAPATGDPALLQRLIGNLVENGIRHNLPTGGWLKVHSGTEGLRPRLQVTSSGYALVPEHVPAFLEPFRREGAERTGTGGGFGLGLSIVQSVVDAHGGHLSIAARPDGGLDVVVLLPAPRPGHPPVPDVYGQSEATLNR
jgi:signal transduction histidine kinase